MAWAGMRQSRPKYNIFGQAQRPAPTKACRGSVINLCGRPGLLIAAKIAQSRFK
jgi:hypothetical protein